MQRASRVTSETDPLEANDGGDGSEITLSSPPTVASFLGAAHGLYLKPTMAVRQWRDHLKTRMVMGTVVRLLLRHSLRLPPPYP